MLLLGIETEQSVHYFWDYFSFFLLSWSRFFLPEGVVLDSETLHGLLIYKNIRFPTKIGHNQTVILFCSNVSCELSPQTAIVVCTIKSLQINVLSPIKQYLFY